MSRSRAGLLGAGLTAGALGAAMLVAPEAAFAAPTTVNPGIVPLNSNATISDPQATMSTTATVVQLATGNGCQTKLQSVGTAASGPWNPGVVTRTATAVTFTVPLTGGPMPGNLGAARQYMACVYDGNSAGSSNLLIGAPIYVGSPAMSMPAAGVTGGGNQLTVTATTPVFTGVNAVTAVFTAGTCPGTLPTNNAPNMVAGNVVRQPNNTVVTMTVPPGVVVPSGPAPMMYNACLYDSSAASLLTFVPYVANVVGVTPVSGSYLASNGVTATSPSPFLSGVTTPAVLVVNQNSGPCPANYATPAPGPGQPVAVTGPGVRRLTNNRAAVTIPPLALNGGQPTMYQICFYAGTQAGGLVGTSNYTAAVVANPMSVVPSAGPAAGGNMITVVGTDFPTDPGKITATLGGAPLTNIASLSDKAFTATAPAHAVEDNVALVVSTQAGTKALPGAYSYLNPISVTPNTAPSTAPMVDVDVKGGGFMAINFGAGGNAGRVFLVGGTYNGADAGTGVRATPPLAECVNVLPIDDTELVCTLQLNRRLKADTTGFFDPIGYINTLTGDVSTTAGSRVITSTGGKFKPDDAGQPIVPSGGYTNIPQYALVTQVVSPSKAIISVPAAGTSGSAFTATVGNGVVAHSAAITISTLTGSPVVTAATGSFSRADVGRVLTASANFQAGTTVISVAPGGASATLSNAASASTSYTVSNATATDASTTVTASGLAAGDQGAIVGPNTLGIPVGTTLSTAATGTATLSAASAGGGTGPLPLNKPVAASLYAGSPVPDGSYNLVVVSNGSPDAVNSDPGYFQTDTTSSSTFTVAAF
jgi:hypothetical protein